MTGALLVAVLVVLPASGIVVWALDLVTDPDWAPRPAGSPAATAALIAGRRPVVTTPAPDPRWLADWLGDRLSDGPTDLYRPALVRPPRPTRLEQLNHLDHWRRSWDRPTPAWAPAPTTAQMEAVA